MRQLSASRKCGYRATVRSRFLFVVAAAAALCAGSAAAFDVQGHRGARGLAPENTMPGFERALALGVTTLETDVALTRDGVVVLSHDAQLNPALTRGADGRWIAAPGPAIWTLTAADLATYDVGRLDPGSEYGRQWPQQAGQDGVRMPTLADLLDLARRAGVHVNVEIKMTPDNVPPTADAAHFAQAVVDVVRAAGMQQQVTIQGFDWRPLLEVRRIAPELPTACLTITSPRFDTMRAEADGASRWHAGLKLADHGGSVPRLVKATGCSLWTPFWRNLDAASLAEARALGLKVIPWTLNETADIARFVDMGTDGVISDYPDRVRAVLQDRGKPLPAPWKPQ